MANEKKPNIKQEKNSKLLEIYLKKQEQDGVNSKANNTSDMRSNI